MKYTIQFWQYCREAESVSHIQRIWDFWVLIFDFFYLCVLLFIITNGSWWNAHRCVHMVFTYHVLSLMEPGSIKAYRLALFFVLEDVMSDTSCVNRAISFFFLLPYSRLFCVLVWFCNVRYLWVWRMWAHDLLEGELLEQPIDIYGQIFIIDMKSWKRSVVPFCKLICVSWADRR